MPTAVMFPVAQDLALPGLRAVAQDFSPARAGQERAHNTIAESAMDMRSSAMTSREARVRVRPARAACVRSSIRRCGARSRCAGTA